MKLQCVRLGDADILCAIFPCMHACNYDYPLMQGLPAKTELVTCDQNTNSPLKFKDSRREFRFRSQVTSF